MDSILITPKNEKELKYIQELMRNIGTTYKTVGQEAIDELELNLIEEKMNTTGILREERNASVLSEEERKALLQSEDDIKNKLTITEMKIQTEEEEWLNQ
ncbi:MAG: hypothetical protein OCD76_15940 [Reichenbachiella sp.]